jgi:hypothetical protein
VGWSGGGGAGADFYSMHNILLKRYSRETKYETEQRNKDKKEDMHNRLISGENTPS